MKNPAHRHVREVTFADTDASGRVHFPNVFRFVEAAEHEFLRTRGVTVFDPEHGGWPRVHASCDFHRPMTCGERVEILLRISKLGESSVHWDFELRGRTGDLKAGGSLVTVRVDGNGRKQPIPPDERAALES